MTELPAPWRPVLQCRSVADKLAVPRDCELCPVNLLPVVSEMVSEGFLVWIDRQMFQARINGAQEFTKFECDVYQLTTKGIALCREHGIEQV